MSARPIVMIVDDNEDLLFLLNKQLELLGYKVYTCLNGKDLLDKLIESKSDIVLLDIEMGSINGDELCTQIRENMDTAMKKIFLMSGNHNIGAISQQCGADGYITKPIEMASITNCIDSVTDEAKETL